MSLVEKVNVMNLAQLAQVDQQSVELMHRQDGDMLIWTTRGQGVVNLHGIRRGFGSHNAIFIPHGQLWSADFGRQSLGTAVIMPRTAGTVFPDQCQLLKINDGLMQSECTSLIEDMRRELMQDRPFLEEALQAQTRILAIWLRRQMQLAPPPKKRKAAERIVMRFCDLASDGFTQGRPMADYADMLEVTPTHLTRVCKQCAGMTAADILVQCTVFQARYMLTHETLTIKAVAEQLGFASAAYFTRFILQHCGVTPSALRQGQTRRAN
jgi:AraC family transcriptional activator of pobA